MVNTFNTKINKKSASEKKMITNIKNSIQPRDAVDEDYGPIVETCLVNPSTISASRYDKACEDRLTIMSKRSAYKSDKLLGQVTVAPHWKK